MKKNYSSNSHLLGKLGSAQFVLTVFWLALFASSGLKAQQTYTFTNCGAFGRTGPTQAQINTTYTNTNLSGIVGSTAGVQTWTVPYTGPYRITAIGAAGGASGSYAGGMGVTMRGDFTLTAGSVIKILVGQVGETLSSNNTGGGGGTFVWVNGQTVPLIIAGGGGGAGYSYNGVDASTLTAGQAGTGGTGSAGTNGSGANPGGGGWASDGQSHTGSSSCAVKCTGNTAGVTVGGASPTAAIVYQGCAGTSQTGDGGFGGGSGGNGNCTSSYGGGGGGGYSGGVGQSGSSAGGGGGGSYNGGTNQLNTAASNSGDGKVIIQELCNISITATGLNPNNAVCSGNSVTLTTNAVSGYSWSTGATTQSIVISPTSSGIYSLTGVSSIGCSAANSISITVSSGLPVLSISNTGSVSGGICSGKSVVLTATGALSYTWSGGTGTITNGVAFAPANTATYTVVGSNACGTSSATTSVSVTPLLVAAASTSSLVCAGSAATLTAFSAVGGYTWQPGYQQASSYIVAPVVNTIYTVTASDGTCVGTATVGISTNPVPTINIATSATNICLGEAVTLSATGGINYTWTSVPVTATTTGQSTLAPSFPNPGAYAFYAVGNNNLGCTASGQVIILVNTAPNLNASATKTLLCADGTTTLNVTGGDVYQWSSNANSANTSSTVVTPANTTTYIVSGTLNATGCSSSTNVVVNIYTPTITITPPSSVCVGAAITLTGQVNNPSSGATNSYTWTIPGQGNSNGTSVSVSPSTPIVATLTAKSTTLGNLICVDSKTTSVGILPAPSISVTPSRTYVCRGEPVDLIASGGASYTWNNNSFSGGTITVTHQNIATIAYSVVGTDASGCKNTTVFYLKINGCQGIAEIQGLSGVNIYPNPSNGDFFVQTDKDLQLQLINELGQVIKTLNLNVTNDHKVEVSDLAKGIYFIVSRNNGEAQAQKIIVR